MFIGIALVSFVPTHVLFFYHIFFSTDGPPNSCSPAHLNLGGEKHTMNWLLSLSTHDLSHLRCQRCPVILDSPAPFIPPSATKNVIPSLFPSSLQQLPILTLSSYLAFYSTEKRERVHWRT